jgi:hypothetical protein
VAAHVRELAKLGVPAPTITPSLYPVPPYLAMQTDEVFAHHDRTSGEGEWALVVSGPAERDLLLTVACDHTDRALEAHGIAWSKQAGPDVLGRIAWRLVDVARRAARSRDGSCDRVRVSGAKAAGRDRLIRPASL